MQSKLQIDRNEFFGTFCIDDCSDKIIAIVRMRSDNLSDLHDYSIYYKSGKSIASGLFFRE